MTGITNPGHTEFEPDTEVPLFILASCQVDSRPEGTPRLWGNLEISIVPGTMAHSIYGDTEVSEAFFCNYELNPDYRRQIEASGMRITGETAEGSTRIVELADHPFYLGTGFVPQLSSAENHPHPIIMAFLKAAAERVE